MKVIYNDYPIQANALFNVPIFQKMKHWFDMGLSVSLAPAEEDQLNNVTDLVSLSLFVPNKSIGE